MSIQIFKNNTNIIFMILVVFLFYAQSVFATLEINEVMYDPIGANAKHQWVEVYNNSPDSFEVDASKWRLNDGSSHYINDKKKFTIVGNGFIILTADKNTFLSDHSGYTSMVIDTVLSLDKDGDTVSLINNGTVVDSFTYTSAMGGSENGKSLQKINNTWTQSKPTIGSLNQKSQEVLPVKTPVVTEVTKEIIPNKTSTKKLPNEIPTKKTVEDSDTNTFPEVVKDTKIVDLDSVKIDDQNIVSENKNATTNKQVAYTGLVVLIVGAFISLIYVKSIKRKDEAEESDFKILE